MSLLDGLRGPIRQRAAASPAASPMYPDAQYRTDAVVNPITRLGDSAVDKGSAARPNTFAIPLNDLELRSLYGNNGIARRIVDLPPSRACRRGWTVPDIGQEDRRLRTWGRVSEAASMARLFGGSIILLVTEDDVPRGARPDQWLMQPLELERVGKLIAMHVFDASEAWPHRWDQDIRSAGFRTPAEWMVSSPGFRSVVHASRVVYFRGIKRPPSEASGGGNWGGSRMPDDSCLQPIWAEIRRLTEVQQGGATLAQELRESVLKIGKLGSLSTSDEADAMVDQVRMMTSLKGILGINVIGPNDEYTNNSNPPTGFHELSDAGWQALAAVTGIAQVVLMGEAPGGLSTDGSSGWEGFRQLVSDYSETNLREPLERIYDVVYAAQDGPTKGVAPDEWALEFAALDEPDESAIAATRKVIAETDAIYIGSGVLTPDHVTAGRFGPSGWALDLGELEPLDAQPDMLAAEALRLLPEQAIAKESA